MMPFPSLRCACGCRRSDSLCSFYRLNEDIQQGRVKSSPEWHDPQAHPSVYRLWYWLNEAVYSGLHLLIDTNEA